MELKDRTCLVTGANSGLGLASAHQLARAGARVILVCRDAHKGEETAQRIRQSVPQAALDSLSADLSSRASVRNLIDQVIGRYSKLDLLFNNAAVMNVRRTVTAEGLEMMFQVNYLAPFMLCTGLLPLLKATAPAQIINIAMPPAKARADFDDLQPTKRYNAYRSFFQTKLYLLLFSLELAEREGGPGLAVNCLDPGPFRSNLARQAPALLRRVMEWMSPSAESAAGHMVALAQQANRPGLNGKLFRKREEEPMVAYWQDRAPRERLWAVSEAIVSSSVV